MTDAAAIMAARLAELWQKSLPTVLERVAILREACAALAGDATDTEARTRGREAAHKLSGSLGIFGLPQGTELAAAMEAVLKGSDALTPEETATLAKQAEELEAAVASRAAEKC